MHKALIDYVHQEGLCFFFFIRAYGSYSRANYHLLRRGFKTIYPDGKSMTFCDNTFSMLFSGMQLANTPFNANQLKELFNQKHLITGFGQTTLEKELAYYTPKGAINVNLNTKGWYKAHIKPVGKDYENYDLKAMFPNPNRK